MIDFFPKHQIYKLFFCKVLEKVFAGRKEFIYTLNTFALDLHVTKLIGLQ